MIRKYVPLGYKQNEAITDLRSHNIKQSIKANTFYYHIPAVALQRNITISNHLVKTILKNSNVGTYVRKSSQNSFWNIH